MAAVAGLAACSGGAANSVGDADDRDDEEQETTTTTAGSRESAVPTSFRASGTSEMVGFRTELSSVVADSRTYSADSVGDGFAFQIVLIGASAWARSGEEDAIDGELWEELDASAVAPLDSLDQLLESTPDMLGFDLTATDLVGQAFIDMAFTDPASLLGDAADDLAEGESELDVALPAEVVRVLGELNIDEPELDVSAIVEDGLLRELSIELSDPGVELEIEATYDDHGEVATSDIDPPAADQIDPTPWLDEEGITAWTDTPLLVPGAVPADLVLLEAVVLGPAETVEGCPQVSLFYAPSGTDVNPERFLSIFLLPKTCATAFDPTEFTEALGGHPARFDGFEVLVDNTVVQLSPSDDLLPEMDAVAASLAPVDAPTLLALVE